MQNKAVQQYIHPVCPTLVPWKKFGQENGKTDTLPAPPLPQKDTLPAGMRPVKRGSFKKFHKTRQKTRFCLPISKSGEKACFFVAASMVPCAPFLPVRSPAATCPLPSRPVPAAPVPHPAAGQRIAVPDSPARPRPEGRQGQGGPSLHGCRPRQLSPRRML